MEKESPSKNHQELNKQKLAISFSDAIHRKRNERKGENVIGKQGADTKKELYSSSSTSSFQITTRDINFPIQLKDIKEEVDVISTENNEVEQLVSEGLGNNLSKKELEDLIKARGPNGMCFSQAAMKRKGALKAFAKFSKIEEVTEKVSTMLDKAISIITDKELKTFLQQQIYYRQMLGIKPQLPSKRNILDEPDIQREYKIAKPSPSKSSSHTEAKVPEEKPNALIIALVDLSIDEGKVNEGVRSDLEVKLLMKLALRNDPSIFYEAGWSQGHRIYTCCNQKTAIFLKEAIENLHWNMKYRTVNVIPFEDIYSLINPRGWIWIPKPYLNADLVINLLRVQNPEYETQRWKVAIIGKQRVNGQYFLIKLTYKDVLKLKLNKMTLKAGMATSKVVIESKEPGMEEEPIVI